MIKKIVTKLRHLYANYLTILPTLYNQREILPYLWKKGGSKSAYNFLCIKLFVLAGGEGTGKAFFDLCKFLFRLFPQITTYLVDYPFTIEVEITNVCNKKCLICEHTYWQEESRHLSFDDFKKMVDQFPRLKWINLTGEGDAFLNRDYLRMIEHLKSKHVVTYLVDSFDLINEDIAKRLIELNVEGIWVSMDGATKETYEKIKVGCSFEKALQNIRNLIRLKKECGSPLPELSFRYIVNKLNMEEMPHFIELIRSLASRKDLGRNTRIEFAGLLKFKEVEHLFVEKIPAELIEATLKKADELKIDAYFAHPEKSENLKDMCHCAAWAEPYLMMGGYVLPCCAVLMSNKRPFLREHSFGNLLQEPFAAIWNSNRYKAFRKLVPRRAGKVPLLCCGCRAYNTKRRETAYGVSGRI